MAFMLTMSACAYRVGSPDRSLPGGYRQVFVPIFKNATMEPGIEVSFTNALIQEFERAKIGRVTPENQAEVLAIGVIEEISYNPSGESDAGPTGALIATQYQILLRAKLTLIKSSDRSVLWSGTFNGERPYAAPRVATAVVNSVNPLYNLSARQQNIEILATKMMSEAHDRITENF